METKKSMRNYVFSTLL